MITLLLHLLRLFPFLYGGPRQLALPHQLEEVQYDAWSFALDVLACPRCGGRLRAIATVEDPVAVRQILAARRPAETLGPGPPAPAGAPAMAN